MPRIPDPPVSSDAALTRYLQTLKAIFNGQVHWIQCQPSATTNHGTHRTVALVAGNSHYFEFQVPEDYREMWNAYVYYIPTTTGTFDWTVSTTAATNGEDEASNADTATADGASATDDQIGRVDCSAAFSNIEAGDLVGVQFTVDVLTTTTAINVILFTFGYYEGIKQ